MEENADESDLFTLIYLDNDDVPELAIIQSGWRLACAEIYTYEQEKTVYVGGYGQWGWTWYLEKEGIIFHPYDHQGRGGCSVHRIEGTEDTLLQIFDWEPDFPSTNLDNGMGIRISIRWTMRWSRKSSMRKPGRNGTRLTRRNSDAIIVHP